MQAPLGGVRLWPGVALGTLMVFGLRGHGALLTGAIVASTTLEAIVGGDHHADRRRGRGRRC